MNRRRRTRSERQRDLARGIVVVEDRRIVAGVMPVPSGYWTRRLRVTRDGSRVRIRAMRPVPR